ncbi:MAG TPA: spermidine/putrescine ABC transporter substrate-binding protein [Ruminiclostridium sp.]|jgi:spermidine/putrescine transport system substrate-binding protein|nr:spermidine/putrescine ABC transporter substrate-binding protein [Clostridiaceae bacterium]HAA25717.1 spermidine/putrescine ABC transporter substrate-binding protein [Ruminiclostridium sp.]
MKKVIIFVFTVITALMLTLLSGCGKDRVVLNVYNWGDYIDKSLIAKFEKETGIKINYEMFETNEHMMAKLETGGTNYDLIFPSDYLIEEMIKKDMLQKIDFNNIPNFKYIDDRFKGLDYDPNNEYTVPYFWGTLGILYNTDMVDEPVNSWDILWDEKYAGKILMLDSMRDTIGVALKRLGYSVNSTDPKEIEEAKNSLIEQKKLVNGYYVDEIVDMMINGDAAIALNWSGAAMEIYWQDVDYIEYAVPEEGANLWFDCMVIPKTSRNKKEAEMFINFLLDPENAYQNTEFVGYSTPNKAALEMMMTENPEVMDLPAYLPSEEILNRCEVFKDLGSVKELYNQAWMEITAQ